MMIKDLVPHGKLGQRKVKVLDAQNEAFHNMCVKQYVEVLGKRFNVEMKLERFPALLRSVKMGLQSSNMSHSDGECTFSQRS